MRYEYHAMGATPAHWSKQAKRYNGERYVQLQSGNILICGTQEQAQLLCDMINMFVTVEETKE